MAGYVAGQDTPQSKVSSVSPYAAAGFTPFTGVFGFDYFADAVQHNLDSKWCRIYATQNTVIASLNGNGTGTEIAVTLNSGCFIDGLFSEIKLTSGSVVCYLSRERNS